LGSCGVLSALRRTIDGFGGVLVMRLRTSVGLARKPLPAAGDA
jgi:hypothetical protein